MKPTLDVETIREMKRQLCSSDVLPKHEASFKVNLTVDGVVLIGPNMLHLETFRDAFGEDAYQELLKQPRVPSPYPDEVKQVNLAFKEFAKHYFPRGD